MTKGFAQEMEVALRQAGAVARMLQGRVSDEGKDTGIHMPHDNDALRRRRAAKTLADEVVQEILLVAALPVLDARAVAVDAEEDTPSTACFAAFDSNDGESLILDPIDGTLEYLAGDDAYSICIGLVRNGVMAAAMVYFAARDVCYALDETGQSFVARSFSIHGWRHAQELSTVPHRGQRIYANGRVEKHVLSRLRDRGYDVVDDTEMPGGAPECILTCLTGESLGYIAHTRQVRDVLLGAIVAGAHGGRALTWEGTALTWPEKGRVERAIFLGSTLPEDLVDCLLERT